MPSCVVKSCKNYLRKLKKADGITYHEFPRNQNRKDDWVLIIRKSREENNWTPSSGSTVCSAHFDDVDFKTTPKGLRCLVPYAIPKKLLSNHPETQPRSTSIQQVSPNVKKVETDEQPPSSSSTISSLLQVPVTRDEFPLTGYCRLCAASNCDGALLNIKNDDVLKKLVENMSNRLITNIDFSQEHLPTTICSVCVKSLYMAYDFVVSIDLAQMTLNKIAMQQYLMPENFNRGNMELSSTSLQQISSNNEEAANHFDQPLLNESSTIAPSPKLSPTTTGAETSNLEPPPLLALSILPFLLDTPRKRRLKESLKKKSQIIDLQRKKLKTLNQKVRRLQNRNESLQNIIKNLKEKNYIDTDLCNTLNENIVAANLFNNFNRKQT